MLETVLRSSTSKTVEEIMHAIFGEVAVFVDGHPQDDDMTLLAFRVQPGCYAGPSTSD